jgi:RecG-like helicase
MKKASVLFAAIGGLVLFSLATPTWAADNETTITGEAKCAKCSLKEASKCQTVIQTEKDGKKVSYYVVNNDVAKAFHKNVCQEDKKVTATGTVKKVEGKQEFTATKIEVAQ